MARGWKRTAEVLMVRSGLAAIVERRARPSTVILGYHNIVPKGERATGDVSLHIDQTAFADHLDFVLERHDVVALGEALAPATNDDRSRVVITFDDAYSGSISAGLDELKKRGLPSTVFVPPGLLGATGFWWDRLSGTDGQPLDEGLRVHALGALQGRGARILEWAEEEGITVHDMPAHARPVDSQALVQDGRGRVTYGAHSWSHPNLTALSPTEVAEELVASRNWLTSRRAPYVDWLAYPYGEVNEAVAAVAASHFAGSLLISGGAASRKGRVGSTPHMTPRVNVPRGLTLEGLALRLAGLLA